MFFTGIIIAVIAFAIIGIFHPIVIKAEYYTGVKLWWVFLLLGIVCLCSALLLKIPLHRQRSVSWERHSFGRYLNCLNNANG